MYVTCFQKQQSINGIGAGSAVPRHSKLITKKLLNKHIFLQATVISSRRIQRTEMSLNFRSYHFVFFFSLRYYNTSNNFEDFKQLIAYITCYRWTEKSCERQG